MFATCRPVFCNLLCLVQQHACYINLAVCAGAGTPALTQRGCAQADLQEISHRSFPTGAYLTQAVTKEHVNNSIVTEPALAQLEDTNSLSI